MLECVERGVDLFESFFPYQVTERGCALTFTFDCQLNPEETCGSSEVYLSFLLFPMNFSASHRQKCVHIAPALHKGQS